MTELGKKINFFMLALGKNRGDEEAKAIKGERAYLQGVIKDDIEDNTGLLVATWEAFAEAGIARMLRPTKANEVKARFYQSVLNKIGEEMNKTSARQ